MRQTIDQGRVAYEPNSMNGGCPFQAMMKDGGFHTHEERIDAKKVRARSASFTDHFSRATLFYNSQSDYEKAHIVKALRFKPGKADIVRICERMLYIPAQVDQSLAERVANRTKSGNFREHRRNDQSEHSAGCRRITNRKKANRRSINPTR